MWTADPAKLVKVLLHDSGEDVETPWAEDEGPASSPPGARRVRLANVPFLHAKPTYGDLIVATPEPANNGTLTWDSGALPYERIGERIAEDGGRWTMIVDYVVSPAIDVQSAFDALEVVSKNADLVLEGLYGPRDERPGRAYLAVPYELGVPAALGRLRASELPLTLTLVHPVDD
jgi:hypothetical protein